VALALRTAPHIAAHFSAEHARGAAVKINPGGASACCGQDIQRSRRSCLAVSAPCRVAIPDLPCKTGKLSPDGFCCDSMCEHCTGPNWDTEPRFNEGSTPFCCGSGIDFSCGNYQLPGAVCDVTNTKPTPAPTKRSSALEVANKWNVRPRMAMVLSSSRD
jgi:hypothetical protein